VNHIESHAGEANNTIMKIYEAQRELEAIMSNLLIKVGDRHHGVSQAIQDIESTQETLSQRTAEVRREVESVFTDLQSLLHDRKLVILRDIEDLEHAKQNKLSEHKNDLLQTARLIQEGSDFVRAAQADQLNTTPEILRRLEELRLHPADLHPREDAQVDFVHDTIHLEEGIRSFGSVTGITTIAAVSYADGQGLREAQVGMEAEFVVHAVDSYGQPRCEGKDNVTVEVEAEAGNSKPSAIDHAGADTLAAHPHSFQDVVDRGDGTYVCRFIPRVDGPNLISVRINGIKIQGSPFRVQVAPAALKFRFVQSAQPSSAQIETDGRVVRQNIRTNAYRLAIAQPALSMNQRSWFKFKITTMKSGGWIFLGLIGNREPREASHRDVTAYGWANHRQVWEGGSESTGKDGWEGFRAGETAIMMFDPDEGTLSLAFAKPNRLYSIVTGPAPRKGFFVHANLLSAGDRVDLIDTSEHDRRFMASMKDAHQRQRRLQQELRFDGSSNDGTTLYSPVGNVSPRKVPSSPRFHPSSVAVSVRASASAQNQEARERPSGELYREEEAQRQQPMPYVSPRASVAAPNATHQSEGRGLPTSPKPKFERAQIIADLKASKSRLGSWQ